MAKKSRRAARRLRQKKAAAWAARAVCNATRTPEQDAAERLALADALSDSFRVYVADVDVTYRRPTLPPELQRRKPSGST